MSRALAVCVDACRGAVARVFAGRPVATAAALVVLALASWALAGLLAWFTWDLTLNLPGRETLRGLGNMAQSTTLYDRDGQAVFTIFKEQRIEVPLDQVSPLLVRAVVAVEDQRFYEHRGIDLVRVLGAMLANLRSGRRAQGGSTITQQLARLSFLTRNKTFRRKLKEMVLATQIEHAFTKDQILELYLNKVYFGDGLYGVEAASRGYFAKPARELSADEAALLAGLIQSPSAYAPSSNLPRALTRRVTVLQAMRESGVIDQATFDRARTAKVVLTNGLQRDEPFGLYFKEAVRRELVDRFGWERVSEGGLRVFTTIDSALQQASERTLEAALARLEARPGYPHRSRQQLREEAERDAAYLQGAAIVLDTATAEVRVLIGGRSFGESRFNRVTQARRQPGSAFKPVIYAAAIEDGASPSTVLTGLDDPVLIPGGMWMPEDEHSSSGAMSLRSALRTSSNRAAVRLIRQIGIDRAMEMVERLRLGPLPAVPSIALGAGEVTLEALTAAYGAFAAGGVLRRPILVRRVEDSDGAVLFEDNGDPQQAMSEVTAYLVSSMLQDVINAGTGARARGLGFSLPAAGKTGTTNDYMDAWFVGFTPRVVTGVWVGFDQPEPIMNGAYAGEVAVPLWTELMKAAAAGHKSEWLARPEELVPATICRLSGQLATPACSTVEVTNDLGEVEVKSMAYTEFYRRGSAPSATCPLHQVELLPEAPVLPQVMPIVPR